MPLTDTQIKSLKSGPQPRKHSDGGGLHLLVSPLGSKLWRLAYRFDGKQKTLAFGSYPVVSLADARQKREAAKKLLASGIDPSHHAKLDKISRRVSNSNTFDAVADELLIKLEREGRRDATLSRNGQPTRRREWQDTVLLDPRERAEIAFVADNAGDRMLHCHILEHQAGGMMSVLRVT